jgi:hypothetical protein
MYFEICVGLVVLACIILIIYILAKQSGPIQYEKKSDSGSLNLSIKANRDIKSIELKVSNEFEAPVFRRQNILKGEVVEFVFPQTNEGITITVIDKSGIHTIKT